MRVEILKGNATGKACAPPSKSMAHRNLICAALSENSTVTGVAYSEDILATLDCLKALGARVEINGDTVTLGGLNPFAAASGELNCRESGSTLRFMLPMCLLSGNRITLFGSGRLLQRPMTVYKALCSEQGIDFYQDDSCIRVQGRLKGGEFKVDGSVSSQFISGLLFACPLLSCDSVINITGDLQSESYLRLTLASLADFGIRVDSSNIRSIKVYGNQHYQNKSITVEGDYSNAAFLEALNCLGGSVEVMGLKETSLQGDKVYLEILPKLKGGGAEISLADCPDLGPILFALAAAGKGATFTRTRRLRIKESDRVLCMAQELSKFGVKMDVKEDSVTVYGGIKKPTEAIFGHNDHRIVMAMAVLSTITGGVIEGAEAVKKSYPDFFSVISTLGIGVKYYEAE
ncbi:MAG: 3-phosphoshikimate 1-carboxyvinyltransferase [Clostridia bacterium]|nr:3-phosphoshikimate 1-carboxyvinyltransferase [Clostridia bacterium]